jgi:hypothetical protein
MHKEDDAACLLALRARTKFLPQAPGEPPKRRKSRYHFSFRCDFAAKASDKHPEVKG